MINVYTLKNGLKIVTEKLEGVNSISVGVMIQNGSRNESEELSGISHFIEHMFFKGTKNRTAKKIMEEIENVGGQINAYTSKEGTCYFVKALNTHLELSLDVLSDILLNSTFNEEEIEKEKGVVLEEINMTEDLPEDVLEDLVSEVIYGNSSIAKPILGTKDKVSLLTRKKILDFIDEKYTPSNSVISICGKFNDDEVKDLIEKYFGQWKTNKPNIVKYDASYVHSGTGYIYKDIEQLHINLALKGLEIGHEKGYALTLLNNIFGGGASSILFQKVREELGLCYSIYSYAHQYMGAGSVNIYTGLAKSQAPKALEVINRELNNFVNIELSDEQLFINKEKIKSSYILGLESTSSRMFANARSLLYRGRVRTQEDVIEKIDKVSRDDLDFVMKEVFKDGIMNASYVGPKVDVEELNSIIFPSGYAFENKVNKKEV
ncbi:MAG: M16 family metallopeptidase [Clostridium sp.]